MNVLSLGGYEKLWGEVSKVLRELSELVAK